MICVAILLNGLTLQTNNITGFMGGYAYWQLTDHITSESVYQNHKNM